MIEIITKSYGLKHDITWSGPDLRCPYCNGTVGEENLPVLLLSSPSAALFIHRECAVAQSAAIANAFDAIREGVMADDGNKKVAAPVEEGNSVEVA